MHRSGTSLVAGMLRDLGIDMGQPAEMITADMFGLPADDQPEYWDFIYFSFAIGTTAQVTDVLVTGKAMRRLVVGHGIVSFFYNVAVLALMVSLGGEFIKG